MLRRVAVVGGGISGLATAYYLTREQPAGGSGPGSGSGSGSAGVPAGAPARAEVTLLEAAPTLGGKVRTAQLAGHALDTGPDAVLVRLPVVRELLTELGLAADIEGPAVRRAYVWSRGALRPLPPMSLFGIPDNPLSLIRSGVLTPWGALRAAGDFVLPRSALPEDPTIAQMLRPRFGREVFDQLIEPMLGGVHAGRADALSARSAVPEVYAVAAKARSVYLAMRSSQTTRPAPTPVPGGGTPPPALATLTGGLVRLTDALVEAIEKAEPRPDLRTSAAVSAIEPLPAAGAGAGAEAGPAGSGGYRLHLDGAAPLDVDEVVLAVPAFAAAQLLRPLAPGAAAALDQIPYVGVATALLAYPREAVRHPLDATGFLVPPVDRRWLVGCTWLTQKWPYLADDRTVVFRCAVGRHGDDRWEQRSDEEIVRLVSAELADTVGVSGPPAEWHLQRWPQAMPQYTVGHRQRLETVEAQLRGLPGVHVTGAAYRGVGIAGCVMQARAMASTVLGGSTPAGAGTEGRR